MKISTCIICCLLLMVSAHSLGAQDQDAASRSARDFVQQFYGWYVPQALNNHHGSAWDLALKDKGDEFSPNLLQALKEDSAAQAKVKDDIVGLDFDPFLDTQDPCKRYELGKITQSGSSYRVEVFSICSGKRQAAPDVVCEVQGNNGQWKFVNFYYPNMMKDYPNSANLSAMLKLLREERQKGAH